MNTTLNKQSRTESPTVFGKNSRRVIMVACVFIVIGYLLMAGPGSTEQHFESDIFSTQRIVVAPMLCLVGYLLIVVAILKKG